MGVSTRAASLHQCSSKNKYPFGANISSCLRPETQILAILPTDRGRRCKRLQVKGVNLVALRTLAALMIRLERLPPLATQIPAILSTDRRRKSRRLQVKAEKRRAAPLSLAVTRRVRLEAREDRLVDVGITGPCCMLV